MCGIAGFIDFTNSSSRQDLVNMTDSMITRGPDGSGYDFNQTSHYQSGLGHRRLSILDLSENGRQPMYSHDDEYALIFNGEVYNFVEIRKWLLSKGYQFKSNSDTEVILYALIEDGIKAVDRFVGMFSIAFFDTVKQELTLIRDRVGVKPLFYSWDGKILLFASETRAFHKHHNFTSELNTQGVANFLDFDYVKKGSIFKSVEALPPASYLKLDLRSQSVTQGEYWNLNKFYAYENEIITLPEAIDKLDALLIDACKLRMVSDVPVGVFLSGGLDSTTVAAILQKHNDSQISTFTIGFEEKEFNEANKAKNVAEFLGTDHHELYCSEKELLEIFPRLPEIYDEPFADKSAIPTTLVSEFARKHVTVALSADGGDEIFAGYNKYSDVLNAFSLITSQGQFKLKGKKKAYQSTQKIGAMLMGAQSSVALKAFSNLKYLSQYPRVVDMMISAARNFGSKDLEMLVKGYHTKAQVANIGINRDRLSQIQAYDYTDYLPDDILVKLDRAAMSTSLEGREPLLDHRIAEFVAGLPPDFKMRNGKKKHLLAEVNARYLPKELINGPKRGFAIPKKQWLKTHLRDYVMTYLGDDMTRDFGVFDQKYVKELLKRYKNGQSNNRVWNILLFHMWYEKWMRN